MPNRFAILLASVALLALGVLVAQSRTTPEESNSPSRSGEIEEDSTAEDVSSPRGAPEAREVAVEEGVPPVEAERDVDRDARLYTAENLKEWRAAGLSDLDLRLRIFSAKMEQFDARIVEARRTGDTAAARTIYDVCASNIAEAYLVATGRQGIPVEDAARHFAEPPEGTKGCVIQLNGNVYVLPAGELPFVDRVKGVDHPRLEREELMSEELLLDFRRSVDDAELLVDSITGGERFEYPD